eukprot:2009995-Alexandrium_andersonii.AAC.1
MRLGGMDHPGPPHHSWHSSQGAWRLSAGTQPASGAERRGEAGQHHPASQEGQRASPGGGGQAGRAGSWAGLGGI